jgi:probable F420-dependent oxidoreductase
LSQVGFGVRLPVGGSIPSVEAVRIVALEAERLGYNSLYARDNLTWSAEQQLMHISEGAREDITENGYIPVHYEPIVALSYVSSITEKIRLVSAVLCLNFRSPLVWAKQVATLDVMSNGRLDVGISPGGWKLAYDALGVPYEERGAWLDETVYAMKELWTRDTASFNGRYIRFKDVVQYPKPIQKPHPPLLLGAYISSKPPIVRRIVEYCDGWIPQGTVQEIAEGTLRIRKRAKKVGKTDKRFSVHLQTSICIARTDEEAWKKSSNTLLADERNTEKDKDRMLERTLVGSPDTLIKRIESYIEAGVTDFECLFIYRSLDDLIEQMKTLMREVAPSFAMRPQATVPR